MEQIHKQKVKSHFDRWSERYDNGHISGWLRHFQKRTIEQIGPSSADRILDVGCGTGWAVLQLGKTVTQGLACGIDLSAGMIEKAIANSESLDRIEFKQGDAENIPYPDNTFDYVMCSSSFHHYPSPVGALKQFNRVLKPGGKSFILDTCRDGSVLVALYDIGHKIFIGDHIRYYHSSEIHRFYENAGFSNVRIRFREQKLFWKKKLLTSVFLISAKKKGGY